MKLFIRILTVSFFIGLTCSAQKELNIDSVNKIIVDHQIHTTILPSAGYSLQTNWAALGRMAPKGFLLIWAKCFKKKL